MSITVYELTTLWLKFINQPNYKGWAKFLNALQGGFKIEIFFYIRLLNKDASLLIWLAVPSYKPTVYSHHISFSPGMSLQFI